ncbi:MAG: response regulator, partial [Rhizobacter sp.]|nr:response regulator [Rhizobacter sp.]
SPLLAWWTQGRYYVARPPQDLGRPGQLLKCVVCENRFETEDMAHCPAYGAPICSLCCTLESRCHDRCKTGSAAAEQVEGLLTSLLPKELSTRVNFRVGHYLVVALSLCTLLAVLMSMVYTQEVGPDLAPETQALLEGALVKVFAMLLLVVAVCSWWVVLGSESRRLAQDESNRQNQLLQREIEAHSRTDAALQAARDVAESANQAKTRYVAGMTHELRTPLNSILGYSQILLKDESLTSTPREAVQTIQRSGEHLLALIDGLLDLARIEAGRLQLEPMPLHLPDFLDELVRMVSPQAEAKGLAFVYTRDGHLPTWVKADAKRLRQILINLLANAVRFTDTGTVTLHVDSRKQVVRFDVVDTGVGVLPQDRERIFLPFERGAAGRRQGGEPGTGLGLTITGLLTSLMGGELMLTSTSGQGSTFSVRVYLNETSDPGPMREVPRQIVGYFGERRTLLVVDDQPVQRQMLAGMLMPLGFDVREAASGGECLASLHESVPDAILLDITMDDMDGWQAATRLRAAGYTDVPIIMVSANVFENQVQRLRAAQCQGFVAKPVLESELIAALHRTLGLEWRAAGAVSLPEDLGRLTAGQLNLPDRVRTDLLRLARVGHVRGLQTALDGIAAADPSLAAACTRLRGLVSRFEMDRLQSLLMDESEVT